MDTLTIALIAAGAGALVSWAVTYLYGKSTLTSRLAAKDASIMSKDVDIAAKDMAIAAKEGELKNVMLAKEAEQARYEQMLKEIKDRYEQNLQELKEGHAKAIEVTRTELALENEKLMKAREDALKKEAEETMKGITGGLDKDIREMKEAFDAQKKSQAEESSAIKTKFDETVHSLRTQTEAIGSQAVDLANALKGRNKMQGIFGETILENILRAEGLCEGRDYESECYLRDKDGNIIRNDSTGKRMRPDFALHFPDDTDVLLDSKVSLTALADYFSADSEEARKDAAIRNLQSVNDHVAELTGKEYQRYVQGRKTLDYVIMFIPNYGAWQLAKQEDPDIFGKAFKQNVLITTEETLIPFLRLIRSAWVQKETVENMSDIIDSATRMIDRVAIFCKENARIEKEMESTLSSLKENGRRLVDSKQSIAKAAWDVVNSGVALSPGKALPELHD